MNNKISDNQVRLGCGTFIAIALIVLIFSGGGGSGQVAAEVSSLKDDVSRLEMKIDALSDLAESCSSAASSKQLPPVELEATSDDMPN